MPEHGHPAHPGLRRGALLALVSAALFGLSTPFVQRFGANVDPFAVAGWLYVGSAAPGILALRPGRDAPLRRSHALRLVIVALFGAVAAPLSLAWGLAHTTATQASLLLASEAAFTVVMAHLLYREAVGRRVVAAVVLIALGVVTLVHGGGAWGAPAWMGGLAVLAASFAWAVDSTLSRPLADLDPYQVVFAKSALGGALSLAIAFAFGKHPASGVAIVGLLLSGALGYGLSLRLYLGAQRQIGAARTGSIFATAPFLGALAAWALGEGALTRETVVAGGLIAAGVYLHVRERHGHLHQHVALEHEHLHSHEDGHHSHAHDPPFVGEHSHRHVHLPEWHEHPHGPDLHHQHEH